MRINIKEELYVDKTIGESNVVWFSQSQSFVLLKSPAYEVIINFLNKKSDKDILKEFLKQTKTTQSIAEEFIHELQVGFDALIDEKNTPYISPDLNEIEDFTRPKNHISRYFRLNGISFRFLFGNEDLLKQFEPLFSGIAVDSSEDTDFTLEVSLEKDLYVFRMDDLVLEAFKQEHIHYLKGAVLKKLAGLVYSISDENWMASFHASAISDGKSAILFSAKPGGGKSTIAALLRAHGYILLSDDFITIDAINKHVWQLPLSISVKSGSQKVLSTYYPELSEVQFPQNKKGKEVHFLDVPKSNVIHDFSFPVKQIVFIKYSKSVAFKCEELSKEDALLSLLEETWVNPIKENVEQFLDWFNLLTCVKITYSDHNLVIKELDRIFKS